MLIVMSSQATAEQVDAVVRMIREMGLTPHSLPGATRTAIGITGNVNAIDPEGLASLPGVKDLLRVTKPYKLASREMHLDDTVVTLPMAKIGPPQITIIAGPCSVEKRDLVLRTAEFLMSRGVSLLRAGAFKPRTSPYAFQGMEHEGLRILEETREKTGIGVVTEVMEADHADAVEQAADILQVGTRNMQNFSLLKRLGKAKKPVLLKRGMSATLEEWLMAAEYLLAGGNKQVILCERGVRTFTDHTRNTLDLSVVPSVKEVSHLPVLVDPSHGTGKRKYVIPMALAGLAAGADGLMVEIHPDPDRALSDAAQTLSFEQFDDLLEKAKRITEALRS